mgnify:FL=1
MSDIEFRFGKKRFYDNSKFPRGFAKSGDFTLAEKELLTLYGDTMKALESKELSPENSEEKQFIKALKSPQKAKSKLEKVWLKYIQLTRGKKRFHSLSSSTRPRSEQRMQSNRYSAQDDDVNYDTEISLDELSMEEEELSQSNLSHSTSKSTQSMEHP